MTAAVPARLGQWRVHLSFIVASTLACLVWSWQAGRDLNWDQLNYHLYSAYQLVDDRMDRDFMAASVQGYLNPLSQVPFYLMVRANWQSLLIGSTLALLHSTCLWLIYGISRILIPASAPYRTPTLAASVALAFLAPIYLVEIGSTFADVTTTIPVLAGIWLLMIHHQRGGGWLLPLAAGFLMGAASGLKLTNAIFALTASAFVLVAVPPIAERIKALVVYAGGGIAGFVALEGAWSYRLYETFGSPLFPFFNAFFRSPDFPLFNLHHSRFIPETITDYLLFPVRMLDLDTRSYTESISPDARFLALSCILIAVGVARFARRGDARMVNSQGVSAPADRNIGGVSASRDVLFRARDNPAYVPALAFTLLTYVLWLRISGNGRYAIPLELFIAPMIPASLLALSASRRLLVYATGAVLIVQAAMTHVIGPSRWMPSEWKTTWYDLEVPEALKARPFLFLSLNKQPAAFLAPFLHRDASFVNLAGQISLALDRPGGVRVRALLDRHRPNIRTLTMPTVAVRSNPLPRSVIAFQNNLLAKVLLEVDEGDCVTFVMHDASGTTPTTMKEPTAFGGASSVDTDTTFLSCATRALDPTRNNPELAQRRLKADRAFDLLEKTCPKLFSPAGIYTDHLNQKLRRDYVNTDAFLWELAGVVEYQGWRYDEPVTLGRVDDILDGKVHIDCSFARAPPVVVRK